MQNELSTLKPSLASADPRRLAAVDGILKTMAGLYGSKFADAWRGTDPDEMRGIWANELAGYTPREIRRGLEVCRTKPWPPTLPEFLLWCRPLTDPSVAFSEAVRQMAARVRGEDEWSHPAVYWAAVDIGEFDLLNGSWHQLERRWNAAYEAQMRRGEWPPIPARVPALPAPGKGYTSREEAAQALQTLGVSPSARQPGRDWARQILEREKAGDKTLAEITVRWARELVDGRS